MNPLPFVLGCLAAAGVAAVSPAHAQGARTPVTTERIDQLGVEWVYEESADPMDDKWQVVAHGEITRGPDRGSFIGFICAEGWGVQLRLDVPRWVIGEGNRRTLQARIDTAPAFPIIAVGDASAPSFAWVPQTRGGAEIMAALVQSSRERIAIRGPDGLVVLFPMAAERPEMARAWERCQELLRTPGGPNRPTP